MNETQKKWQNKYYSEELFLSGRRIETVKHALKVFFIYINNISLDFMRLKIYEAQDFQTYLMTLTDEDGKIHYRKTSVLNIVGVVASFYSYLKKRKVVYANPFAGIKRVKRNQPLPRNILNEEKLSKFLEHLKFFWQGKTLNEKRRLYRAHVISEVMYSAGIRISELISLKKEDIMFNRGLLKVKDTKSGVIRDGILNEYAAKVLKIYVDEMRDYVLLDKKYADTCLLFGAGRSLVYWLNTFLNKESERLGFGKFSSHNFRHAVGYHLLKNGCDIRHIQSILGHKKLSSTQIYTKVDKEDLRGVIDKYHPRFWKKRQ